MAKKKKGSHLICSDAKGNRDARIRIERNPEGQFKKFVRISGVKPTRLSSKAMQNLRVILKAHQVIWKGLNLEAREMKGSDLLGEARVKLLTFLHLNGYTISESGKLVKKLYHD